MLVFPNAKINLGLHIVSKRADGFHELETCFYPVNWCDALEILESHAAKGLRLQLSGQMLEGASEDNILYKAWKQMAALSTLPSVEVHLHKAIPTGAGLGGGSADAAFFIKAMNEKFSLGFSEAQMMAMCANIGSDCSFFIRNSPALAKGRGELLEPVNIDLRPYHILLVNPGIHSDTRLAYQNVRPAQPKTTLNEIVQSDPKTWKQNLVNDFEPSVFSRHPEIAELKQAMYEAGAFYASMSGSGSTVFGLFDKMPELRIQSGHQAFLQEPA